MGQGQEEEEETEQQDPQSKYVVISSVDWVLPLLLSCSGKSLPQISLIYEGGYKHVVSPPPEV